MSWGLNEAGNFLSRNFSYRAVVGHPLGETAVNASSPSARSADRVKVQVVGFPSSPPPPSRLLSWPHQLIVIRMAAAWVLLVMLWNLAVGRVWSAQPTPIVLWHGMGDCCCNPFRNAIIICFLRVQKSFNKKN